MAPERPNVVVVMTDDQTLESVRVMKKTVQLIGGHGVAFIDSTVSYPLCCPSRATFLTGQYAHNHGVLFNDPPTGGYQAFAGQDSALPAALQRAGYRTIHVGKFLNHYGQRDPLEIPPGWSDWNGLVDPSTYSMYGYTINRNGVPEVHGQLPEDYQTDVLARIAAEKVQAEAARPGPFFLSIAPLAPHREADPNAGGSVRAAPRHEGAFAGARAPRKLGFNEADVSDKPAHIRDNPRLTDQQIARIDTLYRDRLESLLAVDDLVELVMEALAGTGQLDETVVIFTSDNGFYSGEHRITEGKFHVYEPALRVPLFIRFPGIAGSRLSPVAASNVDLAPTILDLADAEPGRLADGISLVPFARDPSRRPGRDLLLEAFGPSDDPRFPSYQAIRSGHMVYVEYASGEREFYDLSRDRRQLLSRHADPAYDTLRTRLALRLAKLRRCAGASCAVAPRLNLRARYRSGRTPRGRRCVRRRLRLRVTGPARRRVERVTFFIAGKRVGSDSRAPFRRGAAWTRLKKRRLTPAGALIEFDDGNQLTRRIRLRRC